MSTLGIYIIGATATGKSDLAIQIATAIGAEIINGDSIAFFRGMDIGSAKPSPEELSKIRHHLIDVRNVGEDYTAGEFRRDVEEILKASQRKRFIVVGGSGFYIQAIDRGMFDADPGSAQIREGLAEKLDLEGADALYQELKAMDPAAAERISPRDHYRIVRALEIMRADVKGRALSEIRAQFNAQPAQSVFSHSIKIGLRLPADVLETRIRLRTAKMLERGFVEEVRRIKTQASKAWRPLQSVGYREVMEYLDGQVPESELLERIVRRTIQLARKQRKWFQRDPQIHWFSETNQAFEFVQDEIQQLTGLT